MLSIYIEKTERSDTINLQSSVFNLHFRLIRIGLLTKLTSHTVNVNPDNNGIANLGIRVAGLI